MNEILKKINSFDNDLLKHIDNVAWLTPMGMKIPKWEYVR